MMFRETGVTPPFQGICMQEIVFFVPDDSVPQLLFVWGNVFRKNHTDWGALLEPSSIWIWAASGAKVPEKCLEGFKGIQGSTKVMRWYFHCSLTQPLLSLNHFGFFFFFSHLLWMPWPTIHLMFNWITSEVSPPSFPSSIFSSFSFPPLFFPSFLSSCYYSLLN